MQRDKGQPGGEKGGRPYFATICTGEGCPIFPPSFSFKNSVHTFRRLILSIVGIYLSCPLSEVREGRGAKTRKR